MDVLLQETIQWFNFVVSCHMKLILFGEHISKCFIPVMPQQFEDQLFCLVKKKHVRFNLL